MVQYYKFYYWIWSPIGQFSSWWRPKSIPQSKWFVWYFMLLLSYFLQALIKSLYYSFLGILNSRRPKLLKKTTTEMGNCWKDLFGETYCFFQQQNWEDDFSEGCKGWNTNSILKLMKNWTNLPALSVMANDLSMWVFKMDVNFEPCFSVFCRVGNRVAWWPSFLVLNWECYFLLW